jgi:hypothetical protein
MGWKTQNRATKTMTEKVGGSPERHRNRLYEGSLPGYSVDQVSGMRRIDVGTEDSLESDDEQLFTATMTEAGVDRVFADATDDDEAQEDEDQRFIEGEDNLEHELEIEDDQDLRFLAAQPPLKARRSL